ncbi:MAG: hypothetical protein ACFCUI_01910 [Bernardetiaceae bacterium]
MRYFDKVWAQLFPKDRPKNLPILEEPLTRSVQEKQAYWHWLNEGTYRPLLQELRKGYDLKKNKQQGGKLEVHLLRSEQSNGIAVTYPKTLPPVQFQYLFDLLRDRSQNIGYQHYTSGRRTFDRPQYIETIDKHYLKPPKSGLVTPPFDQQYGNILIEMIWIDRRPSFMRLMAHVYSDHLFNTPRPFDELLDQLLQ